MSFNNQEEASSPIAEEAYNQLKRKMKEVTELNHSINKDYLQAKKKIRTLTFERNMLLDSIHRLERGKFSEESDSENGYSDFSDSDDENDMIATAMPSLTTQRQPTKILKKLATKPSINNNNSNNNSTSNPHSIEPTIHSTAPKKSKNSRVVTRTRRVQPIERDENGQPKLPQQIGVLKVLELGKIITDRPSFHNERYIFPVGYTVSRTYPSMIDPNNNTIITSTIKDGGDGPRFIVTAADMPEESIVANSATGAWTVVVKRSNEIRHREHSNSASGPDYYGFKHPTIAKLIQDLPGAKDLTQYVWQNFEEMEPKAAKGVMAAAEKKRGNLEQMGNANRKIPAADILKMDEEEDELIESDKE